MALTKTVEMPEELFELSNKEFDCGWEANLVEIKRFRFGETNSISREAAKIRATNVGGKMVANAEVDPTEIQMLTLTKGVTKAPWKVNDRNAIDELPPPVANWLLEQIEAFNTLEFKKKGS